MVAPVLFVPFSSVFITFAPPGGEIVFALQHSKTINDLLMETTMNRWVPGKDGEITRTILLIVGLWGLSIPLLILGHADRDGIVVWSVFALFGVFSYWWFFRNLIPAAYAKRKPIRSYIEKVILFLIVAFLPMTLLLTFLMQGVDHALQVGIANTFFQLFVTAPLLWFLYRRQMMAKEEVVSLKRELGQSNANIDSLRSQINPHFLFNVLNTIYGTAIQEGAERTSSAVEKLGDMMRFMLHENMQEKIGLSREIDYLNNYISLQRLRTDGNAALQVETHVERPDTILQIAPMLLIPFVENAFKHGISFREPSHIKVTLEIRDNTLYFDVYNSKHARPEHDPEKDNNGIGLSNVQQRLQLLYPQQHELVVRETVKDFFIHLTLQLT